MRYLFIHPNFPSQLQYFAVKLAQDPSNEVVFLTKAHHGGELPNIQKVIYSVARRPKESTHHYLKWMEGAVLQGQGAYRKALELKRNGFYPDVVYAHSGWGPSIYMKDLFPNARLVCDFEWLYSSTAPDLMFDKNDITTLDERLSIKTRNTSILMDVSDCDAGRCPTKFQRDQFPEHFHPRLTVLHEGINTNFFTPKANQSKVFGDVDLSHVKEIVTYATRGMEPYRGFPQFMEAASHIQKQRPDCHIVIAGDDRTCYGRGMKDKTFKQYMLEKFEYDHTRLHFLGTIPLNDYVRLLRISDCHMYLTRPFVLSWSLLESMSIECMICASDTEPVREVLTHERNALLFPFFDIEKQVATINRALDEKRELSILRKTARLDVMEHYDFERLWPTHYEWMTGENYQKSQFYHPIYPTNQNVA